MNLEKYLIAEEGLFSKKVVKNASDEELIRRWLATNAMLGLDVTVYGQSTPGVTDCINKFIKIHEEKGYKCKVVNMGKASILVTQTGNPSNFDNIEYRFFVKMPEHGQTVLTYTKTELLKAYNEK